MEDPLVGTRIREYEIVDLLGKGGMGAIYKARHIYLDEDRAIKVIAGDLARNPDFVDRFIREAKILTRLRHPNLVQLYEFGTFDENQFFMVLELLHGETVLQRIKRLERIPPLQALKIIREAAEGLSEAHRKGIIHRDISPDNLLLVSADSGSEVTKVIDFGLAQAALEFIGGLTASDRFLGKFEYCSPEQCGMLQEGEQIDSRTDIYSLGATAYHMLTGKLPFFSATAQGYLLKHATETPVPPSMHVDGEISEGLNRLVLKALAKNPKDRYPDMDQFLADLQKIEWQLMPTNSAITLQPLSAESSKLEPGSIFAKRYRIEKKLGEGGMGAVYKAADQILNLPVALKVISGRVLQNDEAVERLKNEVILARKVTHPQVCRIYDIGQSADCYYISMEYLEGATLSNLLVQKGRLNADAAIEIINQVLEALSAAHNAGVIHRDLKPQNIMIGVLNRTWIMDFGISLSSEISRVTRTGFLVGTLHYMSPEQLQGKDIDARSDLYSVGVIFYQLLIGKLPFEGSALNVVAAHLNSEPRKPSEIAPDISPELERVVLKALQKNPEDRYQTAENFRLAVKNSIKPDLSKATKLERKYAFYQWRYLLSMAFAVIVLGLWFSMHQNNMKKHQFAAPAAGIVSINALPWANVKITPLSQGIPINVPYEERVTPCSFTLPEGEYSVELTNNQISQRLIKKIKVVSGRSNDFIFRMPAYDAGRALSELAKGNEEVWLP